MTIFQEIISMLPPNEEPLRFTPPIEVKPTPHQHLISIHGAVATKLDGIFLYDGKDWHELMISQNNGQLVMNSIYQRLKILQSNKKA